MLAVIPPIAYQTFFGIVGDELLPTFVALVVHQPHEDVSLIAVVDGLGITVRGIGGNILQLFGPTHGQFSRRRYFSGEHFGQRLTTHGTIEPGSHQGSRCLVHRGDIHRTPRNDHCHHAIVGLRQSLGQFILPRGQCDAFAIGPFRFHLTVVTCEEDHQIGLLGGFHCFSQEMPICLLLGTLPLASALAVKTFISLYVRYFHLIAKYRL